MSFKSKSTIFISKTDVLFFKNYRFKRQTSISQMKNDKFLIVLEHVQHNYSVFGSLFYYCALVDLYSNLLFKHHNELYEWNEYTSAEVLKFSREDIPFFCVCRHLPWKCPHCIKGNFDIVLDYVWVELFRIDLKS